MIHIVLSKISRHTTHMCSKCLLYNCTLYVVHIMYTLYKYTGSFLEVNSTVSQWYGFRDWLVFLID